MGSLTYNRVNASEARSTHKSCKLSELLGHVSKIHFIRYVAYVEKSR